MSAAARGGRPRRRKFKLVLLGEGRAGKTSILLRFCRNEFDGRQEPTLSASFLEKKVHIDGTPVQLTIWDTAGQERFHALGPLYYRDADAALLVYDISDAGSFAKVRQWVRELHRVVGEDIALAIAGNKIDLEPERQVDRAEAEAYAASVGAGHFDVSAKLNRGLEACFVGLARKRLEQLPPADVSGTRGSGSGIVVVDDDDDDHHHRRQDASAPGIVRPGHTAEPDELGCCW